MFLPLALTTLYCQLVSPGLRPEHHNLFALAEQGTPEQNQFFRADILTGNYFYVGGHGIGNPTDGIAGILDKRGGRANLLNAEALSKLIVEEKISRGIPANAPVFLLSCNSGAGDRSFAQKLSDILHVEVVAPTEWLVIDHYGFVRSGQNKLTAYFSYGRLSLKRFSPQ